MDSNTALGLSNVQTRESEACSVLDPTFKASFTPSRFQSMASFSSVSSGSKAVNGVSTSSATMPPSLSFPGSDFRSSCPPSSDICAVSVNDLKSSSVLDPTFKVSFAPGMFQSVASFSSVSSCNKAVSGVSTSSATMPPSLSFPGSVFRSSCPSFSDVCGVSVNDTKSISVSDPTFKASFAPSVFQSLGSKSPVTSCEHNSEVNEVDPAFNLSFAASAFQSVNTRPPEYSSSLGEPSMMCPSISFQRSAFQSSPSIEVTRDTVHSPDAPPNSLKLNDEDSDAIEHHVIALDKQVQSPVYVLKAPKILQNNPDSPSVVELGLRRSTRNRLPRLQRSLFQRPIYERDAEGNYALVGANEVVVKDKMLKKFKVADPLLVDERRRAMKNRKKLENKKKAELKKRRFA